MAALVEEVRLARQLPPPRVRRLIREAAGVSQVRMAIELGVHRSTVIRWELGKRRPRAQALATYLELLNALRVETTA